MGVVENRIDIMELMKGGGSGGGTAASVSYDNTVSHLSAATVQAALDEINADVVEGLALVNTSISSIRGAITGLGQGITGTRTMIAPIEDGETSSAAYAVGDQLIYNNLLYKVTSAISIGDTITPGTNVANADNVTEQIDELLSMYAGLTSFFNASLPAESPTVKNAYDNIAAAPGLIVVSRLTSGNRAAWNTLGMIPDINNYTLVGIKGYTGYYHILGMLQAAAVSNPKMFLTEIKYDESTAPNGEVMYCKEFTFNV